MLINAFLALSIGFIQYIMDLLEDVLNVLNGVVSPISFELDMIWIFLSSYNWYGHIYGT